METTGRPAAPAPATTDSVSGLDGPTAWPGRLADAREAPRAGMRPAAGGRRCRSNNEPPKPAPGQQRARLGYYRHHVRPACVFNGISYEYACGYNGIRYELRTCVMASPANVRGCITASLANACVCLRASLASVRVCPWASRASVHGCITASLSLPPLPSIPPSLHPSTPPFSLFLCSSFSFLYVVNIVLV